MVCRDSVLTTDSLNAFADARLESLRRRHLLREDVETRRGHDASVERSGGRLLSFACNDYLGLSQHPDVITASLEATARLGVGAGASRLISGTHPEYAPLESLLARLKSTEDAVVFGSGYLANIGIVTALAGARDLICVDELAHSCLLSAATLSRATVLTFPHNDVAALDAMLADARRQHRHCLVLTEGVFSMDGDRAPLKAIADVCDRFDAWLLCDDAHGLGVIGGGRGSGFAEPGVRPRIPLQMGTLSKAVGTYGGYVCASRSVCTFLRNRARTFVYSTGLPPGTVAAARKALEIIAERPELCAVPLARARQFTDGLGMAPAESAVVPIMLGSSERALEASATLAAAGFFVPAIRPPTVPQGTARLRLAFSAVHGEADVAELVRVLRPLIAQA
jgi:8-amino-7-oxononanoate synthase